MLRAFVHSSEGLVNPQRVYHVLVHMLSSTDLARKHLPGENSSSEPFEHSSPKCIHVFMSQIDFCVGT